MANEYFSREVFCPKSFTFSCSPLLRQSQSKIKLTSKQFQINPCTSLKLLWQKLATSVQLFHKALFRYHFPVTSNLATCLAELCFEGGGRKRFRPCQNLIATPYTIKNKKCIYLPSSPNIYSTLQINKSKTYDFLVQSKNFRVQLSKKPRVNDSFNSQK